MSVYRLMLMREIMGLFVGMISMPRSFSSLIFCFVDFGIWISVRIGVVTEEDVYHLSSV